MAWMKKLMAAAAVLIPFVLLAACDRNITHVEETAAPATCFNCHSDNNTFLVAIEGQWSHSKHGIAETVLESSRNCAGCHTSEGWIARITTGTVTDVENPTAIHCFTCHAPHTNNDFIPLRLTAAPALANGQSSDLGSANLCVSCHQARRNVNTYVTGRIELTERWGPHHSVQGDMLLGTNGYEYDDYTYEQIVGHRNPSTDNGCNDCHFEKSLGYIAGGHSFNMKGEFEGEEELLTVACEKCHGEMDDFNRRGVQDSVQTLVTQLEGMLVSAGLLAGEGQPEEFPDGVTTSADSAGAVWNYLMAWEDRSRGVHNSKYIIGLLRSSIEYMQGSVEPPAASSVASNGGARARN